MFGTLVKISHDFTLMKRTDYYEPANYWFFQPKSHQPLGFSAPVPMFRCFLAATLCPFCFALDCSDRSDPVVATCCDAQSAWFSMEAAGGCGGEGATDSHCAHAADLCQRCRAAVDTRQAENSDPLLDQKLSSLDIGFLEMTCVLPQWSPCRVNPTDDWAPLVAAGSLLLLLTLSLVIFDRRGVPCIIGKRLSGLSHDTKQGKPTSLGQSGTPKKRKQKGQVGINLCQVYWIFF